jgi:hypothetical protein
MIIFNDDEMAKFIECICKMPDPKRIEYVTGVVAEILHAGSECRQWLEPFILEMIEKDYPRHGEICGCGVNIPITIDFIKLFISKMKEISVAFQAMIDKQPLPPDHNMN